MSYRQQQTWTNHLDLIRAHCSSSLFGSYVSCIWGVSWVPDNVKGAFCEKAFVSFQLKLFWLAGWFDTWVYMAGFWQQRAAGLVSRGRDQELPLCWTEPLTDGSKRNMPVLRDELVGDTRGVSVIIYLRKGKKCCIITLRSNQGHQGQVRRSGSRGSSAAHGEAHGKAGYPLYSPQRTIAQQTPIPHSTEDSMLEPEESCNPWRAHGGTEFLAGATAHREPLLEQAIPEGLHPTHAGAVQGTAAYKKEPCWSRGTAEGERGNRD